MKTVKSPDSNIYQFNGALYLSKAWKLFRSEMGPLLGVSLLILFSTLIFGFIPVLGNLSSLLSTLLFSGFYIYLRKVETGEQVGGDFFGAFKYSLHIIIYQVILFLLIIPLAMFVLSGIISTEMITSFITGELPPDEFEDYLNGIRLGTATTISILIIAAGSIFISIVFAFTIPLIVDGQLNFWQAMETSRKTVQKQFFNFFGFYLLIGILMIITVLISFGLAIFFWIPFVYVIQYAIYDEIFIEKA